MAGDAGHSGMDIAVGRLIAGFSIFTHQIFVAFQTSNRCFIQNIHVNISHAGMTNRAFLGIHLIGVLRYAYRVARGEICVAACGRAAGSGRVGVMAIGAGKIGVHTVADVTAVLQRF